MAIKYGDYSQALKAIWDALKSIVKSNPPNGYEKVTNIYWDPIEEKIVVIHEE